MRCIFCKDFSDSSKSVEHIIPESLGNKKNFLPKGIVCDKCNSYFAIKIENPLLSCSFFNLLRSQNEIETKKRRIPIQQMSFVHKLHPEHEIDIEFYRNPKSTPFLSIPQPFASLLLNSDPTDFLILTKALPEPPANNRLMSRLLGKIAIEALSQNLLAQNWDMKILIEDRRLDPLINFVRYNRLKGEWPYSVRKIYGENEKFFYKENLKEPVDVLYQYHHFFVGEEMYIIVIIKGYEFALNLGGPSIESYVQWLELNENKSPLFKGNIIDC